MGFFSLEKSLGRLYCSLSKEGLKDEQRFTSAAYSDRIGNKDLKCKFLRVLLHKKISSCLICSSDVKLGTDLVCCCQMSDLFSL